MFGESVCFLLIGLFCLLHDGAALGSVLPEGGRGFEGRGLWGDWQQRLIGYVFESTARSAPLKARGRFTSDRHQCGDVKDVPYAVYAHSGWTLHIRNCTQLTCSETPLVDRKKEVRRVLLIFSNIYRYFEHEWYCCNWRCMMGKYAVLLFSVAITFFLQYN